jgi:hypothetical protein
MEWGRKHQKQQKPVIAPVDAYNYMRENDRCSLPLLPLRIETLDDLPGGAEGPIATFVAISTEVHQHRSNHPEKHAAFDAAKKELEAAFKALSQEDDSSKSDLHHRQAAIHHENELANKLSTVVRDLKTEAQARVAGLNCAG